MKVVKNLIWVIALIAVIVLIGAVAFGFYKKATYKAENPVATIEVEDYGTIKVELYPDQAPEAVSDFVALANNGFYNGTKFHRVVKDSMIQAGQKYEKDDKGKETITSVTVGDLKGTDSTEKYSIKGEFLDNNVNNTIKFEEGVIAMARADYTTSISPSLTTESYNSADSQFFIMTAENTNFNGHYAGFGKVIEGMDVVHKIEKVEVKKADDQKDNENAEVSTPKKDIKVKSIKVETYGVDYGYPETLEPFDYSTWLYQQYGSSAQ